MVEFNRGMTDEQVVENRNKYKEVIAEKIRQIIEIDQLDSDQLLDSVGFSSVSMIELIIELEDVFDIIFEDEELLTDNFKTVSLIADLVEIKIRNK